MQTASACRQGRPAARVSAGRHGTCRCLAVGQLGRCLLAGGHWCPPGRLHSLVLSLHSRCPLQVPSLQQLIGQLNEAGDLLKKGGNRYQVSGVSVRPGGAPSGGGGGYCSGGGDDGYRSSGGFAGGAGGVQPAASQQSAGSKRSWQQAQPGAMPPPPPRW